MKRKIKEFKRAHFYYLMIALLIQLIIYPTVAQGKFTGILTEIFATIVLFAAIYSIKPTKKQMIIALCLCGFAFFGIWYSILIEPRFYLTVVSVLCQIGFNIYIIVLVLISLFREKRVTGNIICGAIAVYLLIGTTFSVLYYFMESMAPGSFCINISQSSAEQLLHIDFVHLSFITITTLGYGDIIPISGCARSFTNLEAVIGVMYVAILISRFVGIYIAQTMYADNKKDE
jgi:hypothetical protein